MLPRRIHNIHEPGGFDLLPTLCRVKVERTLVETEDDDGNLSINGYEIIDKIGKGSGCKGVFLAVKQQSPTETVAIKIVSKKCPLLTSEDSTDEEQLPAALKEVRNMSMLCHENILKVLAVIDDPNAKDYYIALEYAPNGCIVNFPPNGDKSTCEPVPEERAKQILRQTADALSYMLCDFSMVHLDIKPENILLGEHGQAFLADFGSAEICECIDFLLKIRMRGTPAFLPPEVLDGEHHAYHAFTHDVWSLGVTLFMMLVGKLPFPATDPSELREQILAGTVVFPATPEVSEVAKSLVRGMLITDPEQRWTLADVLRHPFLATPQPNPTGSPLPPHEASAAQCTANAAVYPADSNANDEACAATSTNQVEPDVSTQHPFIGPGPIIPALGASASRPLVLASRDAGHPYCLPAMKRTCSTTSNNSTLSSLNKSRSRWSKRFSSGFSNAPQQQSPTQPLPAVHANDSGSCIKSTVKAAGPYSLPAIFHASSTTSNNSTLPDLNKSGSCWYYRQSLWRAESSVRNAGV